jgi:K+-transporting ATPase ATPase C chain
MRSNLLVAVRATFVTLALTGLVYPLVVTGLAQAMFHEAANGSVARDPRGAAVGSSLIGQAFASPAYLQPRPSAAGGGYDATASSGANLGPTSAKLRARAQAELERLRRENPQAPLPVPADLVMASASGLDPHVSPAAALWQVPRIARARGVDPARVREIVERRIEGRELGVLGEPRVDVLAANQALDRHLGAPPRAARTAATP